MKIDHPTAKPKSLRDVDPDEWFPSRASEGMILLRDDGEFSRIVGYTTDRVTLQPINLDVAPETIRASTANDRFVPYTGDYK